MGTREKPEQPEYQTLPVEVGPCPLCAPKRKRPCTHIATAEVLVNPEGYWAQVSSQAGRGVAGPFADYPEARDAAVERAERITRRAWDIADKLRAVAREGLAVERVACVELTKPIEGLPAEGGFLEADPARILAMALEQGAAKDPELAAKLLAEIAVKQKGHAGDA